MGAGTIQKGALGQQLAAAGRARRADQIGRSKEGPRKGGPGRDRSRAVIEDQMDQNDATGKQKQGKGGRPGKPIVSRPIEEGGRPFPPKEGRPFEPPMKGRPPKGGRPPRDGDVRIQPFPYPGRGEDQFGPGGPVATLPYFPGKPPGGGRPGKPDMPGRPPGGERPPNMPEIPSPRPPVEKPPWGREDDPNYGRKKDAWHQRRKEMEMEREMKKGGGTEFGPGRGSRIPEGADVDTMPKGRPFGNDQLPKGFKGGGFLQDFLARISQLKGGGIK